MKARFLNRFAMVVLFASLAISAFIFTAGQIAQAGPVQHHHYALIDIGTFGGTLSSINDPSNFFPAINGQGQAVGFSANKIAQTATSNPTACGLTSNVTLGFELNNGSIKKLGGLADSHFCNDADAINDYGEIAGLSEINVLDPEIGLNEVRAVVWRNGQIANLGTLGGNESWSFGINDSGQVIGMSLNAIPDPYSIYDFTIFGSTLGTQTRAFLWQKGSMKDLGTLGGPDAWPFFINQFGQIAGNSYTNTSPNASTGFPTLDPFLWTKGKMQDLGTLGGVVGFVQAMNDLGEVVGGSSIAAEPGACFSPAGFGFENDANCHPFLWDGGKLIDLSTSTSGAVPVDVRGINDFGEIVGGGNFSGNFEGYLWIGGTAIDLGHLSTDCFSEANAINLQGQIVGESFDCSSNNHAAVLWEAGSVVDLNSLVPAGSSLQLVAATAINSEGEIAGNGAPPGVSPNDIETMGHAFVLIPCDEKHPGVKGCDYSTVETETAARPAMETRSRITGFSPTSGRVGTVVQISGRDLQRTSAVTFSNGVKASFTVNSRKSVTTTVPAGAATGVIAITTPHTVIESLDSFVVEPPPPPPACYVRGEHCAINPPVGAKRCCPGLVCQAIPGGLPPFFSYRCAL